MPVHIYTIMKKISFLIVLVLAATSALAQKLPLDEKVYDGWKSMSAPVISNDGRWVSWEINPQQGDGWLFVRNQKTGRTDSIHYGYKASFSRDGKYLVYQVKPSYSETRQAKKKKLKDDQMPKGNLGVRLLDTGKDTIFKAVKSYSIPEKNSDWMAFLLEKKKDDKKDKQAADTSKTQPAPKSKAKKSPEPKGTELVVMNPLTGKGFRYQDVTEYIVPSEGSVISFLQDIPDTTKTENFKVNLFDTGTEVLTNLFEATGSAKKLAMDKKGQFTSFIHSADTGKIKVYNLWLAKGATQASRIVDTANVAMPAGWSVNENASLTFSEDNSRLYFGTNTKPVKEPEDTLLDDEKYKLDIWSWDDPLLQPMQKKQLEQEKKRSYLACYDIAKKTMVQLADKKVPEVRTLLKGNCNTALGTSDLPYRIFSSWDVNNYTDYYTVDIPTGKKTLILEKAPSRVQISPSGKYLLYWDQKERGWFAKSILTGIVKNITASIPWPLWNEIQDTPQEPAPYGIEGWLDDEKHVLIRDRYDIWIADLAGEEAPVCLTNQSGRKNGISFQYQQLDRDAIFIQKKDPVYLTAFNNITKESGFYFMKTLKKADPVKLEMGKCYYPGGLTKAKDADILLWRKGSFSESPELYTGNMDLSGQKKLSVSNPQQSGYLWGSAELVKWTSFSKDELDGILYKPENFDSTKSWPMIVYFYERSSDQIYTYTPPSPSPSRINITMAMSNGYLVFVPDIKYKEGFPGQSCYDAVVSGTNALLERHRYIDGKHLGLDGQSWGGYQIAWLVTRTDMFACAYAGAAVVDMISAYGGIRWESGMSRAFQYEMDQSRIGGTLWEKPLHYIENSPIFQVPRINTPLLLMNNDADGAVPWYQGIEFITALRRLGKPAWMLTYNDEAHNLMKRPNRKDISIRKMEFFDHYLKGAPMPYWMKYGISQEEKGKKDGYELVK